MNKLWLIVRREYLTRVTKRAFWLGTLLTPLAFGLFFLVVGWIFRSGGEEKTRVAVVDDSGILAHSPLPDAKGTHFLLQKEPLEAVKKRVEKKEFDGVLRIPALPDLATKKLTVFYFSDDQLSPEASRLIEKKVSERLREFKIDSLGLDKKQLETLATEVTIDPEPIKSDGRDASSMTKYVAMGIGGAMGFIMYMTIFIYGMMIMRSVMEEKTSRIVEVMMSSVRPFQLMMGKIIGAGAVGLTQVLIWAVLIFFIQIGLTAVMGPDAMAAAQSAQPGMGGAAAQQVDPEMAQAMSEKIFAELANINWWLILPLFLFYFLGGYFLYSSMFAAVGSAVSDDMGESQSLTIPITIPVAIAFYIMFRAVEVPHSSMAVWASIFPLFSPIVMPARLAFDPPAWQIAASVVALTGTAIGFVWLAGRIYRVGILMYGKKVTFKELGKWLFYKG